MIMPPDSKIWLITGKFTKSVHTRTFRPRAGSHHMGRGAHSRDQSARLRAAVVTCSLFPPFSFSPSLPLVVGTSSGLGLALVRRVLARGDRVIATARARAGQFAEALLSLTDEWRDEEEEEEDRVRLLELDVSAPFAEVRRQAEAAIAMWGRVDVLVNNAGTVGREVGPSEELGCVCVYFFACALSLSLFYVK